MRKKILIGFLLSCVTLMVQAQSFKLFYANNVTDVLDLDDIEEDGSGLNWREVAGGSTITIDGNLNEVNKLKEMLGAERMKGLDDKRQFWKMRDHTLLCFRIDEESDTHHTYEVLVSNGVDSLTQTVDDFFFVNVPTAQKDPYEVVVSRVDNPDDKIRFRYFVYDWDDKNLYMFMLDQKRQVSGETYTLEYVTGHMDEDGDLQKQTKRLQLQSDKFQSFYVPANSDLLDVFLMSGDDKKLRLEKSKLHSGIDLNNRMSFMELSSTFNLDKHEGREMMNFNWLGTGLYENFDTLRVALYNEKGKPIKKATFHPERVDYEGNRISDPSVRYFGYDEKSKTHKIITMSNPAYIEILVNDYIPVLYKYDGATDEEGVVNTDRCQAFINMRKGKVDNNSLVISDQHFLNLNDERAVIVRNNVDHRLCSIDNVDLSGKVEADTLSYMEDCGNEFPKLLDNKVVERFAQLEVSFSRPKGGAAPSCELTATDIATLEERKAVDQTVDVVRASEFKSFTYDYYFVRFNLLDVIQRGEVAKLSLQANDLSYSHFPFLRNMDFNRVEMQEAAEEEVNEKYVGANENTDVAGGFADAGYDLKLPIEFKFSFKPVSISTAFIWDIRKNLHILKINLSLNRGEKHAGDTEKISDARKDVRDGDKYDNFAISENVRGQVVGDEVSFDDWIYEEIDDIFDVSANRIGTGWFGGARLCFKMPPFNFKRFQVSEAAGQVGYGFAMQWDAAKEDRFKSLAKVLDKCSDYLTLTANFEASLQSDFGIKSFNDDVSESMSSTNMGYFFQFSGKLAAGATLELQTPEKIGSFKLSSVFNMKAGLRLGGKVGFRFGVEGPFDSYVPGVGANLMGLIVGQAYFNMKTLLFHYSANAGFHFGGRVLIPDNDHNPYHKDFPYWLNEGEAKPMSLAYKPIPAPTSNELIGKAIVNDLAVDANPHFLGEDQIVYNDLGVAADYNDDKVVMVTKNGDVIAKKTLSVEGKAATNNMRSKQGNYEIVAFEQMSKTIDPNEITTDNVVSKNSEIQQATHIRVAMRQKSGEWTYSNLSDEEGDNGYADLKPAVAMQEDGHAAIVYQHGTFDVIDPEESADSLNNIQFKGQLLLRTYNGTSWSSPVPLYDYNLDKDHLVQQYDLVMRNDTVLVLATLIASDMEKPVVRYASKSLGSDAIGYYDEVLDVRDFYMKRVGKYVVTAMVYEGNDSVTDIYVKTISMTGKGDGVQGNDLGVGYKLPGKVKIISDNDAEDLDNFAVMWTQMSNEYRGDDGKKKIAKDATMMLNASRIFVSNALQITDPITLGAETDGLVITDFDGYLDDAHICAVYTLANVETSGALLMYNDKYFSNSYTWDVAYGSAALLGSSTLPVIITVDNTGTSAIEKVTAIINGEAFEIPDSHIKPYDDAEFVVQYPITDAFDGFITSQIAVEYANVYKIQAHPRHQALSYRRQTSEERKVRVTLEDVECNVVSHTIEDGRNAIVVELIDHESMPDYVSAVVGVFPHPNSLDELGEDAMDVVQTDEFEEIGGVRKAYTTLYVDGVTEPIQAYVNCHLVDWSYFPQQESMLAAIKNVHALENPTLVNLFPTEDPSAIVRPSIGDEPSGKKAHVTRLENGVRLTGVSEGMTVRVFTADGMTLFKKEAVTSTMFVPLSRSGDYLLSTGEEVFKFRF